MKIVLIDVQTSGHRIEYARYLTQYLIDEGHEVHYWTRGETDRLQQLQKLGAKVSIFNNCNTKTSTLGKFRYRLELYQYYNAVFEQAANWNADIIHHLFIDGSEITLFPVLLKKKNVNWKFFGTYFNQALIRPTESLLKEGYRYGQRFSIKFLVQRGDISGLFVHHSDIKDQLSDRLSINKRYISAIPDPIEPPSIKDSKDSLREKLGLPLDDTILLFFGGTRYEKGPDILLDAIKKLNINLTVVYAGQAKDIGKHEISKIQSKIGSNISLISRFGFVPDDEIYEYFLASDAVLLPYRSEYTGTSGILQRAIASGRPVIGTDCGVVGTIIREWDAGIVVEPDSSVEFAKGILQFIKRKNFNEINGNYVENHHWKNLSSQVLKEYEKSIEN